MDQMTRAAVLLLMLLAGCSEEKPTQAVNEAIESPLQNTVISSFDTYPPKRATQEDLDLVASIPSACVGKGQPLRLLSSAPR
jgi:PBP1b-binding outer membrane lipoprotein LpoB